MIIHVFLMELILIFSLLSPFLTLRHESTLCCAYRHIHRIPVLYIREEDISVIFRGFNKTSVGHIRPILNLSKSKSKSKFKNLYIYSFTDAIFQTWISLEKVKMFTYRNLTTDKARAMHNKKKPRKHE